MSQEDDLHAFLLQVVHDLRSPLNAASMWADLLRQMPLSSDATQALETIQRNLNNQVTLLSDLSEAVQLNEADFELTSCRRMDTEQFCTDLQAFADEHASQLSYSPPDVSEAHLKLDRTRFFKALGMLVDFARPMSRVAADEALVTLVGPIADGDLLRLEISKPTSIVTEHELRALRQPPWQRTREEHAPRRLDLGIFIAGRVIAEHGGTLTSMTRAGRAAGGLAITLPLERDPPS